ncbi:hypothetical protein [uncultured Nostoc sp.]
MHITLSTVGKFFQIVASFIEHYLVTKAQKKSSDVAPPTEDTQTPPQS